MLKLATKPILETMLSGAGKRFFQVRQNSKKRQLSQNYYFVTMPALQSKIQRSLKQSHHFQSVFKISFFVPKATQKHSDFVTTLHRNPKGPIEPGNPNTFAELNLCFIVIYCNIYCPALLFNIKKSVAARLKFLIQLVLAKYKMIL